MTWFKLAFRNVFRQKKRSFLLASAIAFGMLSITLLNSLTGAMGNAIKTNFSVALGGHVYISGQVVSPKGYSTSRINQSQIIDQAIASLDVLLVETKRRSSVRAQFVFGSKTDSLQVQGVQLANETLLEKKVRVIRGDLNAIEQGNSVALPMNKARQMGVSLGDTVLVKGATASGQQNLLQWQVVALIADQGSFGRSSAYASLKSVNAMLNIEPTEYQRVNLVLEDMQQMHKVTEQLKQQFSKLASLKPVVEDEGGMRAMRGMMSGSRTFIDEPWQGTQFDVTNLDDVTESVMSVVNGLDWVAKIIFAIMLVITLVGISNSYRMVLLERVAEIGNMRAMGAQASNVFRLFIYEAIILAVLGTVSGLVLAEIGILAIESLSFEGSRGPARMFTVAGQLPLTASLSSIAATSGLILIMCVFAAYFPARSAAKLDPAEALRTAT